MSKNYILSLDQGTTSSRAILVNHRGEIVTIAQKDFSQIFPQSGWVEHDANEIWSSQVSVAAEAIAKAGFNGHDIAAIGITNQRETTIIWDKDSGEPIYNAIVWQDRRTAKYCDKLREQGHEQTIQQKTGLRLMPIFPPAKSNGYWITLTVRGIKHRQENSVLAP